MFVDYLRSIAFRSLQAKSTNRKASPLGLVTLLKFKVGVKSLYLYKPDSKYGLLFINNPFRSCLFKKSIQLKLSYIPNQHRKCQCQCQVQGELCLNELNLASWLLSREHYERLLNFLWVVCKTTCWAQVFNFLLCEEVIVPRNPLPDTWRSLDPIIAYNNGECRWNYPTILWLCKLQPVWMEFHPHKDLSLLKT